MAFTSAERRCLTTAAFSRVINTPHRICGPPRVFCCRCLHRESQSSSSHSYFNILFLGRGEFSCLVLEELFAARDIWNDICIVTQPDERTGRRGASLTVPPLKTLAQSLNMPVHTIPHAKADFKLWKPPLPFFSATSPPLNHLLVTASFGRILSTALLQHFAPTRRLNVHPSLLPAYRGAAPIQHTILNGEKKTGVCVIEMLKRSEGIDAGAIWRCSKVSIPEGTTFSTLQDTLAREGGKLLVSVLRDMMAGKATPIPQPPSTSPRATAITAADSILDFITMTAEDIVRRHRAISHQRPLITYLPSVKTLQLHSPSVFLPEIQSELGSPSLHYVSQRQGAATYHAPTRTLLVRCAGGSVLSVPQVKQEGKALLDAKEFWNGAKGLGLVVDGHLLLGRTR